MKKSTYYKKIDNIRKKAINATANVISAPARAKASYVKKRSDNEVKILKNARNSKGAPKFYKGKPTEAFKYKTAAEVVRRNIKKRNKKQT